MRDLSRTPVRRLGLFKPHTAAFGNGASGVPHAICTNGYISYQ